MGNKPRFFTSIPLSSPVFHIIIACSLMGIMGVSLISPVLPEIRDVFGVSDARVGLIITAFTLPGVIISPFAGLLADRFGRRDVVIPLLFLFGISGSAIAFTTTFEYILILRVLQGIGGSVLITLSVTLIGDLYEGTQQDTILGINSGAISIGASLYPLIGGLLATIFWSVPFLFYAIGIFVGLISIVILPEPEYSPSQSVSTQITRMKNVVLVPEAFVTLFSVFFAFFLFYGAILTAVPLILTDQFDLTSSQIGLLISVVSIATALVSFSYRQLGEWKTGSELIAIGFCAYGVSLLFLPLVPSAYFATIPLSLFGVGTGLVVTSADKLLVRLVPDELRAGTIGVRTSVLRIGQTTGPVIFTFVAQTFFKSPITGYSILFVIGGVSALIVGLIGTIKNFAPG